MSEKQEMLELANRIRDIAYAGVNNFDDFSSYKLDLIQDYAKLLQASLAAPSPHPRGEPVGYVSAATISALGEPEGSGPIVACAAFDTVIPLYAAPPPAGADAVRDLTDKAAAWDTVSSARQSERRKTIEKVVDILRRRAAGYDGHRATAIFNGRIIADELRGNAREIEALADALPAPQPQEKPTGDQT